MARAGADGCGRAADQDCGGFHTASRMTIWRGIRPRRWKRSATACWVVTMLVGDPPDREQAAVGRDGLDLEADAGNLGQRARDLVAVCLGPAGRLGERRDGVAQHQRPARREVAIADKEGVGLAELARFDEDAAAVLLPDGEIRIPDRPDVDAAARERGGRIRRAEIDGRDVAVAEARLLQRDDGDVVRAGALGEADALAFEVGKCADG